ncbi:hypothetical protein GDO86_006995 [Hymenochirus boettgeri]|uniref:Nanos-type domain-containing protein n=1 Tax=Hymenochirus boettgeri TaxID=247094 RepID=A0A8T2J886_9PIPI|nr:hypothetical protein GDO86_006995 [Hymenochirus boettgeri]
MELYNIWIDYFHLNVLVRKLSKKDSVKEEEKAPKSGHLSKRTKPLVQNDQTILSTRPGKTAVGCSFCKHNGESLKVYTMHRLKDKQGKISCPILRKYVCPQCGASGDNAHTLRFCPMTRKDYCSVYQGKSRNAAGKKPKKMKRQGTVN